MEARHQIRKKFLDACQTSIKATQKAASLLMQSPQTEQLRFDIVDGFLTACKSNHLEIAKWLYATYEFEPEANAAIGPAMTSACELGNLEMAKWLAETVKLSGTDLRHETSVLLTSEYYAFNTACFRGHKEVAEWFSTHYDLTIDEVRGGDVPALTCACTGGQFEIAKWLYEKFNLNASDFDADDDAAFKTARAKGYDRIAEWIISERAAAAQ